MGRVGRLGYWTFLAIAVGLSLAGTLWTGTYFSVVGGMGVIAMARLHDIGRSAGWIIPIFILAGGTGFLILQLAPEQVARFAFDLGILPIFFALGLVPGQPGANRHGEPPVRKPRVS